MRHFASGLLVVCQMSKKYMMMMHPGSEADDVAGGCKARPHIHVCLPLYTCVYVCMCAQALFLQLACARIVNEDDVIVASLHRRSKAKAKQSKGSTVIDDRCSALLLMMIMIMMMIVNDGGGE
jgi:hypothetical protein